MKSKSLRFAMWLLFLAAAAPAQANPVDVSYTVSGSAGNWLLDFTFANNIGGSFGIYFVGVQLPATDIAGSPPGWAYASIDNPWTYTPSAAVYNNPWCTNACNPADFSLAIMPSQTLNGFVAHVTELTAPSSVAWFAYADGLNEDYTVNGNSVYEGPGCFQCGFNPGFEGIATNAVPVPAALPLFVSGLGTLGFLGWRRKRKKAGSTAVA